MNTSDNPRLLTTEDVAELLGVQPQSVRSTLRRYGITEVRGYREDQVKALRRLGRGHRSDLNQTTTDP